ncbi:hypothetical protein CF319_g2265 [Tilletia indica]|nr:hypothetical protein CF319_g2265 [Tilletia indica]
MALSVAPELTLVLLVLEHVAASLTGSLSPTISALERLNLWRTQVQTGGVFDPHAHANTGGSLKQIEDKRSDFFVDNHNEAFVTGAVCGQLPGSPLRSRGRIFKSFVAVLIANAQPGNAVNSANASVAGQEGGSGNYKLKSRLNESVA